jgi:hypothetical protein
MKRFSNLFATFALALLTLIALCFSTGCHPGRLGMFVPIPIFVPFIPYGCCDYDDRYHHDGYGRPRGRHEGWREDR